MLITAKDIYKSYQLPDNRRVNVLKGINLGINQGDYIAIKGSSGSGKSTLLNVLASIDSFDEGQLLYTFNQTQEPSKLNDSQLSQIRIDHIGFVFQFHHLLPEFTAIENVLIPTLIKGAEEDDSKSRATELLEMVGVLNRAHHKPSELSGGEQQRVAIARALINKPQIVFADEPTGNLDEKNTKIILDLINDIQDSLDLTFVTATHSNEVAERANSVFYLHNGLLAGH